MLETNFTSVDDDFITLWSQECINKNTLQEYGNETFFDKLIALASLGQINALQSVLIFPHLDIPDEVMSQIKILVNKDPLQLNYNEYMVKAHYMLRFDDEAYYYINLLEKDCLKKHKLAYESTKNPRILERYYELKYGWQVGSKLITKLTAHKLNKQLKNLYNLDNQNSAYAYAYGKNLYFFGNSTEKKMGKLILTNLAGREFSKELNDKIDEIINEKKSKKYKKYRDMLAIAKDLQTYFNDEESKIQNISEAFKEYNEDESLYGNEDEIL